MERREYQTAVSGVGRPRVAACVIELHAVSSLGRGERSPDRVHALVRYRSGVESTHEVGEERAQQDRDADRSNGLHGVLPIRTLLLAPDEQDVAVTLAAGAGGDLMDLDLEPAALQAVGELDIVAGGPDRRDAARP